MKCNRLEFPPTDPLFKNIKLFRKLCSFVFVYLLKTNTNITALFLFPHQHSSFEFKYGEIGTWTWRRTGHRHHQVQLGLRDLLHFHFLCLLCSPPSLTFHRLVSCSWCTFSFPSLQSCVSTICLVFESVMWFCYRSVKMQKLMSSEEVIINSVCFVLTESLIDCIVWLVLFWWQLCFSIQTRTTTLKLKPHSSWFQRLDSFHLFQPLCIDWPLDTYRLLDREIVSDMDV